MSYRFCVLLYLLVFVQVPARALAEPARDSDMLVSVVVKLTDMPLARYQGGLRGLAATQTAATGASRLDPRSPRSRAYLAYLDERLNAFERAALLAVPRARVVHRYRVVLGGASMIVPAHEVSRLAMIPGVAAIYPDRAESVTTDRSPKFIGATKLWKALGGQGSAGEGVVVGVLDTGVWPEHPSYSDPDPLGRAYPPPPLTWNSGAGPVCEAPTDGSTPLNCNNKLIGARKFLATYKLLSALEPGEFDSPRDSEGHGTHVSSTAAGNGGVAATVLGIARGTISGIAPRAHVAMYRVCGSADGCFHSDSAAAVQQAIVDGVDVINYSIGGGESPYSDVVSLTFLDAYAAGVFVAASAGNDGPGPDTVDQRAPWITTVAASTEKRQFLGSATLTSDQPRGKLKLKGASLTGGIKDKTPVVWAGDLGDAGCLNPLAPGSVTGAIVACERGTIARVEKGLNVLAGGAAGLLLYNPTLQGLASDNHFLPALHVENDLGTELVAFLTSHLNVLATLKEGKAKSGRGDVVASFSSRGGADQTLGIGKPDVTAPGVQILAGHTPEPSDVAGGPAGEFFQAIQGTSMSSPHVAGGAALVRDLHPEWTPGQIKSALMTTARTKKVLDENGLTPADPFDVGSGRIDLKAALKPGVTLDVLAADYVSHQSDLWNVNYPSLYVPAMSATLAVERTLHNVSGKKLSLKFKVAAPPDLSVVVSPEKLTLDAGAEGVLSIVLDATAVPADAVRHAHIRAKNFHFPITIVRGG